MPDFSPELAGKVLGADLRNLVKKVGEGAGLSDNERDMMRRFLAESTPSEDLLRARKASLVVKWAKAGKLTKEEKLEAGIPEAAPSLHRQTSELYKKPFKHYAALYSRDVRNIKRMVSDGRKQSPPDFPPFDDPPAMAAWSRRVKGQEPRGNLTKFEREAGDDERVEAAESRSASQRSDDEEEDDPSPLPAMSLESGALVEGDDALNNIRALAQATFKQMAVALKRNRMKEYKTLFIEYKQLVQVQRSWEKDITKIQEGRGEVLRTREVNTEVVQVFTTLGHSFYNVLLKTLRQFAPKMPSSQQRSMAKSLVDGCYAHCKRTRWTNAWPQDAIVIDVIAEPS